MVRLLLAFSLHFLGGVGSSIAAAAVIARDAFVRNANGCWSPTRQVTINTGSGNGAISPGMTFCTGTLFMGVNLPEMLNQQCLGRSLN
jgi:hypothetical protein